MDLRPINPSKPVFAFACFKCTSSTTSDTPGAVADLHGPAFRAWYCGTCAAELREKSKE